MKSLDIVKAILSKGSMDISEADMKDYQDMSVGIIEHWDEAGKKTYTIYLHESIKKM